MCMCLCLFKCVCAIHLACVIVTPETGLSAQIECFVALECVSVCMSVYVRVLAKSDKNKPPLKMGTGGWTLSHERQVKGFESGIA